MVSRMVSALGVFTLELRAGLGSIGRTALFPCGAFAASSHCPAFLLLLLQRSRDVHVALLCEQQRRLEVPLTLGFRVLSRV